jgi:pimeloyl-ACP methyl ester carboxylesterase
VGLAIYGSYLDSAPLRSVSDETNRMIDDSLDRWGEGHSLGVFAPSIAGDPESMAKMGIYERAAASPSMVRALMSAIDETDVTDVLPNIRAPTLVLHRRGDFIPI